MSETEHERWSDELAAYLLGALDPGEATALERHVEGCAECRAELRWLQPAVDLLPDRVERHEPPPALRERVVAEARSDLVEAAPTARRRMPFSRMRLGGWRPVAVGAVAALMLVAAIGLATRDDGPGEGASTTIAAGEAPGMTAELVMEGDSATLQLANVRDMPEDRVLEAWIQRDGEVTPVRGLFVPDRSGRATATIPDMRGVEAVMVTAEPRGGSESPTSAPMVIVETS